MAETRQDLPPVPETIDALLTHTAPSLGRLWAADGARKTRSR